MLWTLTVAVLAFAMLPNYIGLVLSSDASGTSLVAPITLDTVIVTIDEMTCKACALVLQKEISAIPGVSTVEVNYEKKKAVVAFDKGTARSISKVLTTIRNAGFRASCTPTTESLPQATDGALLFTRKNKHEK